jgi:hypothetical protein
MEQVARWAILVGGSTPGVKQGQYAFGSLTSLLTSEELHPADDEHQAAVPVTCPSEEEILVITVNHGLACGTLSCKNTAQYA